MEDSLAIINRIIEWHQTLRASARLVGDSVTDREALLSLEEARPDWIPGRVEVLTEKQKALQQTIDFLDDGLQKHFAYEEQVLPPLLGELFMQALIIDHREIRREISEAKSTVASARLEGLDRDELLAKGSDIQQVIDGMFQVVEGHCGREEVILEMVRRVLQERAETGT